MGCPPGSEAPATVAKRRNEATTLRAIVVMIHNRLKKFANTSDESYSARFATRAEGKRRSLRVVENALG